MSERKANPLQAMQRAMRLREERTQLENSLGHGGYHDGIIRRRLEVIDRELGEVADSEKLVRVPSGYVSEASEVIAAVDGFRMEKQILYRKGCAVLFVAEIVGDTARTFFQVVDFKGGIYPEFDNTGDAVAEAFRRMA